MRVYVCVSVYLCVYECKRFCVWVYVRKEMFYLMTHSTHFIYGYMALDIW